MRWFIAFVRSCTEKKAVEYLSRHGFECYLPVQRELRKWSDRNKLVDRLVIPGLVFVHCSEKRRRESLKDNPYMYAYMSDKATSRPAFVRDHEMDLFRMMVDGSGRRVSVNDASLKPGDIVRVVNGPLAGKECELVSIGSDRYLVVRIPMLGAAGISLERDMVEKIEQ